MALLAGRRSVGKGASGAAPEGGASPVCLNCGCGRVERFCPQCGQENLDPVVPIREVLKDAFEDLFKFDSRLMATLRPLLLRPGFLTAEFLAGRRAPYLAPMKLFLSVSAAYVLLFTLTGGDRVMKESLVASARAGMATGAEARRGEGTAAPPPTAAARPPEAAEQRRKQIEARAAERMAEVGAWYTENLSLLSLALLPAYAFALWALYRGRRLFVECFVCTLHAQSALYLLLLPVLLARQGNEVTGTLTLAITPLYGYLALRGAFDRAAGAARWKTALRTLLWTLGQILFPLILGIVLAVAYIFGPDRASPGGGAAAATPPAAASVDTAGAKPVR